MKALVENNLVIEIKKKDWKKILLKPNDSIGEAIHKLNSESTGIILVVNDEQELLGTGTDGDIRRAMLNKLTFDTIFVQIYLNTFVVRILLSMRDSQFKRLEKIENF